MPPCNGVYLARCRDTFAKVQEHAAILFLETAEERPGVFSVHIGDAAHCLRKIWVVCLLDVAHNAAVEALHAGVTGKLDALARGDPS